MRFLLFFFFLVPTIFFSSCDSHNDNENIEKALSKTFLKFAQLKNAKNDNYNLERIVKIRDSGVELQLHSTSDTLEDQQKVIIVINELKRIYVIPLLSNTYHDYWNFQFDSLLRSVPLVGTTFEKELTNCFNELNLYDSIGRVGKVLNEIFISLLQCQKIGDSDSLNLQAVVLNNNGSLTPESTDSCFKRNQKNWSALIKAFHPEDGFSTHNAYWDKSNNRVYQFDLEMFTSKQKTKFRISNYRLDCIYQMFYL